MDIWRDKGNVWLILVVRLVIVMLVILVMGVMGLVGSSGLGILLGRVLMGILWAGLLCIVMSRYWRISCRNWEIKYSRFRILMKEYVNRNLMLSNKYNVYVLRTITWSWKSAILWNKFKDFMMRIVNYWQWRKRFRRKVRKSWKRKERGIRNRLTKWRVIPESIG